MSRRYSAFVAINVGQNIAKLRRCAAPRLRILLLPLMLLLACTAVDGAASKLLGKNLLSGSNFGSSGDWTTGGSVNFCASASAGFPCNDGNTRPSGLQTGNPFALCYSQFSSCFVEQSVSISTSDATPYEYNTVVRSGNAIAKITIKASSAIVVVKRSSGATYKTFTTLATSTTTVGTKVFDFPWPQNETQIKVAVWNIDKYNTDVANTFTVDEMYVQYLDLKLYGTATMSHSSSLDDTHTMTTTDDGRSASMTTSAHSLRRTWTMSASSSVTATRSMPTRSWSSQLTITVTRSSSATQPSRSASSALSVTGSPSMSQTPSQSSSLDVTASKSPSLSSTSTWTESPAVTATKSPSLSSTTTWTESQAVTASVPSLSASGSETRTLSDDAASSTASLSLSATPTNGASVSNSDTHTQSASLTQTLTVSENPPTVSSSLSKSRRSSTLSHTKSLTVSRRTRSGPTASRSLTSSRSRSFSKSLSISRSPTFTLFITASAVLTLSTTTTLTLTVTGDQSRSNTRSNPSTTCTPTPSRHTLSPTVSIEIVPVTRPPVSLASELTLSAVTGAGGVVSAPVIGVSTLLAAVGEARCVQLMRPRHRDWGPPNPLLYLLSPFYGNSLGMVVGNFGLMVACCLLHLVVVRVAAMFKDDATQVTAGLRFPNGSLVFAHLCVQGMLLGGWQLIWGAVNSRSPSGVSPGVATLIGVVGIALSAAPSFATGWVRWSLLTAQEAHEEDPSAVVTSVELGVAPSTPPWARALLQHCGPPTLWMPPELVQRFGVAFKDFRASRVVGLWMAVDRWAMACVVLFVCAMDPPSDADIACDVTMYLCGGLLTAHAVWIAWLQPFLMPWPNYLQAVCVLLLAVFCMLQAPSSIVGMGVDTSLVVASCVTILLSACVVVLVVLDVAVAVAVRWYGIPSTDGLPHRAPKLHDFRDDVDGRYDRYSNNDGGSDDVSHHVAINAVEAAEEDGDGIEMHTKAAATTSSLPSTLGVHHHHQGGGGVGGDVQSPSVSMHGSSGGGAWGPSAAAEVASSMHHNDTSRPKTPTVAFEPARAASDSGGQQQHQQNTVQLQKQRGGALALDDIDDML